MLILTRLPNQTVMVGDIAVTVLAVRAGKVRMAVGAEIVTCRPGQQATISDGVSVTVLRVRHEQVRLGFDAPLSVPVHREEVYRRIQAESAQGGQP
jgi:carbon storage regulator